MSNEPKWRMVPIDPDTDILLALQLGYRSVSRGGVGGQTLEASIRREYAPEMAGWGAAIAAAPSPCLASAPRLLRERDEARAERDALRDALTLITDSMEPKRENYGAHGGLVRIRCHCCQATWNVDASEEWIRGGHAHAKGCTYVIAREALKEKEFDRER